MPVTPEVEVCVDVLVEMIHDILVALCERDGLSIMSEIVPDAPAPNFELAARLGIGHVFGI
jgi:hypothetical protein